MSSAPPGFTREADLPATSYQSAQYFDARFIHCLGEQIQMLSELAGRRILEIGKGNGFVSEFLKHHGYRVTTFDINPSLHPDIVGNCLELDRHVEPGEFDIVSACEVLEHIPFEHFDAALAQLSRVAPRCLITLPEQRRFHVEMGIDVQSNSRKLERLGQVLSRWRPRLWLHSGRIGPGHCWEINHSKETRLSHIRDRLASRFTLERSGRMRAFSYMMYFILGSRTFGLEPSSRR